jgi:hypothetical protein
MAASPPLSRETLGFKIPDVFASWMNSGGMVLLREQMVRQEMQYKEHGVARDAVQGAWRGKRRSTRSRWHGWKGSIGSGFLSKRSNVLGRV